MEANSLLEKEEQDLEKAISDVAEVQVPSFHSFLVLHTLLPTLFNRIFQRISCTCQMLEVGDLGTERCIWVLSMLFYPCTGDSWKSALICLQMVRIHDKMAGFEELDLLMEKEREQLEQLKNMLFVDQLMLSFHKSTGRKSGEYVEENARSD